MDKHAPETVAAVVKERLTHLFADHCISPAAAASSCNAYQAAGSILLTRHKIALTILQAYDLVDETVSKLERSTNKPYGEWANIALCQLLPKEILL